MVNTKCIFIHLNINIMRILTMNTMDVSLQCTPSDTRTGNICRGLVSLSIGLRTRTIPVCASNVSGELLSSQSLSPIIEYVSVESRSGSTALRVATCDPIGISSVILYSIGELGHVGRLSFLSKIVTFTFLEKK